MYNKRENVYCCFTDYYTYCFTDYYNYYIALTLPRTTLPCPLESIRPSVVVGKLDPVNRGVEGFFNQLGARLVWVVIPRTRPGGVRRLEPGGPWLLYTSDASDQ